MYVHEQVIILFCISFTQSVMSVILDRLSLSVRDFYKLLVDISGPQLTLFSGIFWI
jgi:hypothetical protein